MDLIDPEIPIDLQDPDFKIYARNYSLPSTYIADTSNIKNSLIAEGCQIYGKVEHSVISTGCVIEDGAYVKNAFIMPNTVVKAGADVRYSIIGEKCTVSENARVGEEPENSADANICVIKKGSLIKESEHITE